MLGQQAEHSQGAGVRGLAPGASASTALSAGRRCSTVEAVRRGSAVEAVRHGNAIEALRGGSARSQVMLE